jgi:hypothetical protein
LGRVGDEKAGVVNPRDSWHGLIPARCRCVAIGPRGTDILSCFRFQAASPASR